MTLCDTGPLVALIDRDDANHERCATTLQGLPASPLLTTWPCLTEAQYLLRRAGGLPAQEELWGFLADGLVRLLAPEDKDWERMRTLMQQYADSPMDLADASLVVAAERCGLRRIFSLDSHFRAYRIHGTDVFDVVVARARHSGVQSGGSARKGCCRPGCRQSPVRFRWRSALRSSRAIRADDCGGSFSWRSTSRSPGRSCCTVSEGLSLPSGMASGARQPTSN